MYVPALVHTWDELEAMGTTCGGLEESKASGFLLVFDSKQDMEAELGNGVPHVVITRRKQPKARG